jgi:lipid-binding SYLF domain-containing protein
MDRRSFILASAGALVITATACETSQSTPQEGAAKRREIDAAVDSALTRLYSDVRGSRELVQKAEGVLVFPSVFKAGFIVGGEYGEGALRVGGRTAEYYSATAGAIGLLAGAQTKSVFILFMTREALAQFRQSSGWTVGADAAVTVINVGAGGTVTAETVRDPVVGFVLTNQGLMVDVSLQGMKITPLKV